MRLPFKVSAYTAFRILLITGFITGAAGVYLQGLDLPWIKKIPGAWAIGFPLANAWLLWGYRISRTYYKDGIAKGIVDERTSETNVYTAFDSFIWLFMTLLTLAYWSWLYPY
ncbi:MAG: hypothetical protein EOO61_10295 [Hymenobacter sp.]|nr:MAG: hypothetical protein EOO61_10295 [Hymenobacter sp.]